MADIEIEIDGQKLKAAPDQTIIQVADEAGIYIPRFCYHKHLSIAANCRMCLVEVEKSPKAVPACATPVMSGMKVFTRSPKTVEAQRAVMEFLLINHPLDCPICDQGGECELQDLSMGYGSSISHYDECKRAVADEDLGPLIATEMTRCILCTRCVRFGDEIAGLRELGVTNRGGDVEVTTYVQHAIKSEISGNIIDLCPVGALTSKPYRFTARAWELDQMPSVSPHDCLGSNINIHTRYGQVKRIVGHENAAINETWISDRDRFGYTGLYHADRLKEPMARIEGKWQTVEWQTALEIAAGGLQKIISEHTANAFGALGSPNSTLEEFYLLQKIVRGLGSSHVDHRLREIDTKDQEMHAFLGLGMPISELEHCDGILLVGSNLPKEQPLLATRIRKAVQKGATVAAINPVDYTFNFALNHKIICSPAEMVPLLDALANAKSDHQQIKTLVEAFKDKKKIIILLGAHVMHHPNASHLRFLAQQIAKTWHGNVGYLTDGANSAGGWIAGAIPHRSVNGSKQAGMNAYEMFSRPLKAYLLLNIEPEFDCANATQAKEALKEADFIVALSMYKNALIEEYANVILPMGSFAETSGTYVNTSGVWQSFQGAATPYHASRPAWKILRVLGNFLHLQDFDYETTEEIRSELKQLSAHDTFTPSMYTPSTEIKNKTKLSRIGEIPLYSLDSILRRAKPLQETQVLMEGDVNALRLHPETAKKWAIKSDDDVRVKQQQSETVLKAIIDERIAENAVWIAGGVTSSIHLGDLYGDVEIEKKADRE